MKIAIVDSGIHPGHPHVGEVAGGVGVTETGFTDDYLDRLGHGTAVAGAIRERSPDAALYAVKIFDRRLSANIDTIARALAWCVENEMDLINLSLGTANPDHRERFVGQASWPPLVSVASLLPGTLPGVIAVAPEDCPRDTFRYRDGIFYASPYPRPIPGVPPERNLHGASFAVANMTGFAAQVLQTVPADALRDELIRRALAQTR
ncbi:MAG TPA: S8 family serine peptidase [Verrucomicrobiae bacterium]|nr:S8 family serine peptidase [Verrucomicrobiae bacterium]